MCRTSSELKLLLQHGKALVQRQDLEQNVVVGKREHLEEDGHVRAVVASREAKPKGGEQRLLLHTAALLTDELRKLLENVWVRADGIEGAVRLGLQDAGGRLLDGTAIDPLFGLRAGEHVVELVPHDAPQLTGRLGQRAHPLPQQGGGAAHEGARSLLDDAGLHQLRADHLRGLVVVQEPDMVPVHPLELVLVEDRCHLAHPLHLEGFQKLLDGVNLLVGTVVPAELRQVIDHA
mmetsp:Transcript_52744/g.171555  ORF Transcript_52744/g.171555 Transcript_52744/m.171555 type:complete len:234 (-) Transcript_52744:1205-1906(-)